MIGATIMTTNINGIASRTNCWSATEFFRARRYNGYRISVVHVRGLESIGTITDLNCAGDVLAAAFGNTNSTSFNDMNYLEYHYIGPTNRESTHSIAIFTPRHSKAKSNTMNTILGSHGGLS
jgi:hypothetical protein